MSAPAASGDDPRAGEVWLWNDAPQSVPVEKRHEYHIPILITAVDGNDVTFILWDPETEQWTHGDSYDFGLHKWRDNFVVRVAVPS